MEHGEARARLTDAAAVRGGVEAVLRGDHELATHLAECEPCAAEAAAWSSTAAALEVAFGTDSAASDGAIGHGRAAAELHAATAVAMPPELRARTLAFVRERGIERSAAHMPAEAGSAAAASASVTASAVPGRAVPGFAPPRAGEHAAPTPLARRWARASGLRLLAAAAAVVVMLGAGAFVTNANRERDAARAETAQLAWVVDSLGSVMSDPGHRSVTLADASGHAAGSVAWSPASRELVVVTTALAAPPAGGSYHCWVERDGIRQAVGRMEFAGNEAYWAGPVDPAVAIAPGVRFGVTLANGASISPGAPAVLSATF